MANVYASVRPSGLDRTPVAAMSGRHGFKFLRGRVDGCVETCPSDNEDSDDEDSVHRNWSPSPPWNWRLLVSGRHTPTGKLRQQLRDKHYMLFKHYRLLLTHKRQDVFKHYKLSQKALAEDWELRSKLVPFYGRLPQALAKGAHPLSTMDRVENVLPPY